MYNAIIYKIFFRVLRNVLLFDKNFFKHKNTFIKIYFFNCMYY